MDARDMRQHLQTAQSFRRRVEGCVHVAAAAPMPCEAPITMILLLASCMNDISRTMLKT